MLRKLPKVAPIKSSPLRKPGSSEWSELIVRLSGAWKELSLAEEGRENLGQDVEREGLNR